MWHDHCFGRLPPLSTYLCSVLEFLERIASSDESREDMPWTFGV